ncbi:MAG: hypothetical protein DRO36_03920 [Candidatus Hecatellales archaeon]|nr:MAG: hypothetical protein DRO36_03920 [Candidatus Hecatellales archaeon]
MGRKFLAAREDLVEKVKDLAKKKNLTLYALVNDALEQILKAEETGKPLPEIVENYQTLKMVKEAGFILTPANLWYGVVEKAFKEEDKTLEKVWSENGEWFGKYCKTMFPDKNLQELLEKIINTVFWDLSDCTVTAKENGEILVRCVGSRYSTSHTTLLASFILGLMQAYNYKNLEKDVSKGILSLTFKKEKGE